MWVATEHGFYSVVAHRDDDDVLLVRARAELDLIRLVVALDDLHVPHGSIEHTPDADYAWRVPLLRQVAGIWLAHVVQSVDYDNFKDRVAERDPVREGLYHQVWAVLRRIQRA